MYISHLLAIFCSQFTARKNQQMTNETAVKKTTTPIMEFLSCDSSVFLSRDLQSALRLPVSAGAAVVCFTTKRTVPPPSLAATLPARPRSSGGKATLQADKHVRVAARLCSCQQDFSVLVASRQASALQAAIGWVRLGHRGSMGPGRS